VGSLNFAAVEQTAAAFIAPGASVNQLAEGEANTEAGILVHAFSDTDVFGIAGAASINLGAGFGAGLDLADVIKRTEASAGGDLAANRNVEVLARSRDDLDSLSTTLEAAAVASLGGAIGISSLDTTTRASVSRNATVRARGNLLVSADSDSEVDVFTGALQGAVAATGGAAAGVALVDKTTEAFIGEGADVVANAQGPGIDAATGEFMQVPSGVLLDDLVNNLLGRLDLQLLESILAPVVDNPVSDAIEDVVGGDFYNLLVSPADIPPLDLSVLNARSFAPVTEEVRGVAVTATNRDDVETLSVGMALSYGLEFIAAEFSAGAAIASNDTRAYVDDGARVNAGLADGSLTGSASPSEANEVALEQGVRVAAGNHTSAVHLSGTLARGGSGPLVGGLGPSVNLSLSQKRTAAFIGKSADVRSPPRSAASSTPSTIRCG
jgi:hypothetical protein